MLFQQLEKGRLKFNHSEVQPVLFIAYGFDQGNLYNLLLWVNL